ncbi:hypothetical protein [Ruegeria aquimaris]|uniref:Argininosuccinate lyase n=1 Tax=Ruegeria aquimaris TaxID=2984333 RepID=A0ABT3AHC4_9RHOB|nr:hypothetical protein [Ruegeria sp. XHP0148]MCV2888068.1 hypothetical protein [Ruegeria sp. XHP0148]
MNAIRLGLIVALGALLSGCGADGEPETPVAGLSGAERTMVAPA